MFPFFLSLAFFTIILIFTLQMLPKKNNKPPTIRGEGFNGSATLTVSQLQPYQVDSFLVTAEVLANLNWGEGVYGMVGLTLTADNKHI